MSAITYLRPATRLDILIGTANGILRVPEDAARGRRGRAPEKGRKERNLLRALVAYKEGKKK